MITIYRCLRWVAFIPARWLACQAGAVAPLMALLLVPISGVIAIAAEQGAWYYLQRSMQNAADSAALAAATNNSNGVSTYQAEAAAAAAGFGYVNGQNNATVGTATVACPAGAPAGATCYKATLSTIFPVTFSRVVGFNGNTNFNGGRGQTITASAVAATNVATNVVTQFCIGTLGPGNSFQSNGGPRPDLGGCNLFSYGSATCNGHNLGAAYGYAVVTNSGCGINQVSNSAVPTDPYAALVSNIPPDTCTSYPQETGNGNNKTVVASNRLTGSYNWSGNHQLCGDQQLTGNVTLTQNTTIIINNGLLDLNGHTLSTANGVQATIVFSGSQTGYNHYPTDNSNSTAGAISIVGQTGAWNGVAIYQDPRVLSTVDFTYAGNKPAWNISGAVYLPKANVTFSGVVNKNANGSSCFALVAYTLTVNGTAQIFSGNTGCTGSGTATPSVTLLRPKLVL